MKALTANTISRLKKVFCLGSLLIATLPGSSQGLAKADLSITSIIIGPDLAVRGGNRPDAKVNFGNLKCTITVHNENGGLAFQTKLVVLLPVETTIISNLNSSTEYRSNGNRGSLGSLLIDLSHIGVGQDRLIEFTFTRSAYGSTVGAYVFSGTPDPKPSNNFKEATY